MTLEQLRKQIDQVDDRVLRLLNQRASLAKRVGAIKQRQGRRLFDPRRERAILRRLAEANQGPLSERAIHAIYREILQQVRRAERVA